MSSHRRAHIIFIPILIALLLAVGLLGTLRPFTLPWRRSGTVLCGCGACGGTAV